MALQAEAEVRRFDPTGALLWSTTIDEPEMADVRERFFERNREDSDPNRFALLQYFNDLQPVGEDLWLLLNTGPGQRSVVIVLDQDGNRMERLELDVEEVSRLAVDVDRRRLYMASSADAQVYVAEMP